MPAFALTAAAPTVVSSLPAALSQSVWRADQMAAGGTTFTSSGHALLDQQLPGTGWPHGGLIELLLQQAGIGEMRLLQPALSALAGRRIALLQPPYLPQLASWSGWDLPLEQLLWIRAARVADALWSAEQILRNGSCGALLFWQPTIRTEALRRLQLAAQSSDTVCWIVRPLSAAQESSPATLRLALRPQSGGVRIDILKRRGPLCGQSLSLQWPQPWTESRPFFSSIEGLRHACVDSRAPAVVAARVAAPALV